MEKFKKVSIYILWLLLFSYLLYIDIIFFNMLANIIFYICGQGLEFAFFPDMIIEICSSNVSLLFDFIIYSTFINLLYNLLLYIFYYKLYKGKKNRYKFFREREKKQKYENNLAWKEYCENIDKE